MGAPQLHIKKRLNYRTGCASRYCRICDEFCTVQIKGIAGQDLGMQPRCKRIGLDAGLAYRINPKNICDAYDATIHLAKLKKGSFWE
ncbi:MAG: hypothetical protein J0652_02665 [Desulfobulbaceae bacterium]|nr:hypothetical protein [Desulfobulbaceae bacterium]